MTGMQISTAILVYLAIVNVVAFAVFGTDKARAKRGEWRISERALMLLAVVGGGLGALAGMLVFHHKTHKPLFQIGVPIALIAQLALVVWLLN